MTSQEPQVPSAAGLMQLLEPQHAALAAYLRSLDQALLARLAQEAATLPPPSRSV